MMSDFSFVLMPRDRKSIDVRRHKYIDQSVLNSVQLVNTDTELFSPSSQYIFQRLPSGIRRS